MGAAYLARATPSLMGSTTSMAFAMTGIFNPQNRTIERAVTALARLTAASPYDCHTVVETPKVIARLIRLCTTRTVSAVESQCAAAVVLRNVMSAEHAGDYHKHHQTLIIGEGFLETLGGSTLTGVRA